MALKAWIGPGGGVIVNSEGKVILCETCPCACVVSVEIPEGYTYDGATGNPDIDFSGTWTWEITPGASAFYEGATLSAATGLAPPFDTVYWRIRLFNLGPGASPPNGLVRINPVYSFDNFATSGTGMGNIDVSILPGSMPWDGSGTLTLDDYSFAAGPFAAEEELELVGCS